MVAHRVCAASPHYGYGNVGTLPWQTSGGDSSREQSRRRHKRPPALQTFWKRLLVSNSSSVTAGANEHFLTPVVTASLQAQGSGEIYERKHKKKFGQVQPLRCPRILYEYLRRNVSQGSRSRDSRANTKVARPQWPQSIDDAIRPDGRVRAVRGQGPP